MRLLCAACELNHLLHSTVCKEKECCYPSLTCVIHLTSEPQLCDWNELWTKTCLSQSFGEFQVWNHIVSLLNCTATGLDYLWLFSLYELKCPIIASLVHDHRKQQHMVTENPKKGSWLINGMLKVFFPVRQQCKQPVRVNADYKPRR